MLLAHVILAATLVMAPLGAQAADLVVWWEKGYDDQENEAVRHHMTSAIQFLTRPRTYSYWVASGDPRHLVVNGELVWAKAVHRVVADGISAEQAVDEAIARIKEIVSE
jgi:multiple sugar transport system substrate-binding protein